MRALHSCAPALKCVYSIFIPTILWLMRKKIRQRLFLHAGCRHDIGTDLEAAGLSQECIPRCLGGACGRDYFLTWFEERRQLDEQQSSQRES